jgi:hypothetical protein
MKNEPLMFEAEMVENTTSRNRLGMTLSSSTQGGRVVLQKSVQGAQGPSQTMRGVFRDFWKATVSNMFLLGCLLGLFFLYCCSCVIHALMLPARKKSS